MTLRLGDTLIAGSGANQDLSNLTSQGKNIANWSNNVTNCITEIPQDIKLELNNGTLTLKAGSKVYVPNGAGVFDTVTQITDYNQSANTIHTSGLLLGILSNNQIIGIEIYPLSLICSGESDTLSAYDTHIWYDTTNNYIKVYSLSSFVHNDTLPLASFTGNGSNITSIQVFNGFGYIGSTVFALPGVKGLIPNGRNADGSLKNIEVVVNSVNTYTITGWERLDLLLYGNSINVWPSQYSRYTDENFYEVYDISQSKWVKSPAAVFGFASFNSKITSLTTKTPFHALDYNDSSTISGWGMPSSRYIDLTLGASGATYTAPANGWVYLNKNGNPNQFLNLVNVTKDYAVNDITSASAFGLLIIMPINKEDVFRIDYNLDGATNTFRFIYAEGEN